MSQKKILYISQEIYPYVDETPISNTSRFLPQAIQEKGMEIRAFMPKYGNINERRNQLHEVIRLSGMNLIIDDSDNSLIIKVASIQSARMQVYFIDNEDYFQNRETLVDKNGEEYDDNEERSIFFVRGVMETIKKLRWVPDIIHCHGWFSGLAPLYVKKGYKDDPCFKDTKIVYSIYDETFKKPFSKEVAHKLRFEGIGDAEIEKIKSRGVMDYQNLIKLAVDYSDGVVLGSKDIDPEITKYLETEKVDFLPYQPDFEKSVDEIEAFYNKIAD
ncbi:MAG TPA: glycogen/starch synthase [Fermentimonas caenicola]|jgi:starch synthase|uniref:starch synthase n=1 Tax=Fermentimonas caenicola TaxID=1562970 RepID=A0A098C2I8_9BACT|nr:MULTISPECIES: glycogen/starch synthase [Lascolabacillus]MBP6175162.1 glycogen/starch synthase [Fermentimonas sp.]MDI9626681.1 glycogen/starch synthase [Bacteroidota bacterium]TAH62140.1 MAG: glycogen synthase [Fermentimonas caenicola]MBP6196544.1 glycogen/starch synthase [Fermentimonas sp.]MBP7104237.1 glycogen/starch synthase [Fermentimonas sp.]